MAGASAQAPALALSTDSVRYVFDGIIGDKARIQADITLNDTVIRGTYFYFSVGQIVRLEGTFVAGKAGQTGGATTVTIKEFADTSRTPKRFEPQEAQTGVFQGMMDRRNGTIKGTWVNAKGTKSLPFTMQAVGNMRTIKHARYLALVEYPVFSLPELRALNDTLARTMKVSYDSCVAMVKSTVEELARDTIPAYEGTKWEERISSTDELEVAYISPVLVSLMHNYYTDGGGAHGNSNVDGENWLITNGIPVKLRLNDLFKPDANYLQILTALLVKDLKRQQASFVVDGSTTPQDIRQGLQTNQTAFTIQPSGLHFYFPPYAVASYAEGMFEVKISYKAIKDLLPPDSVLMTIGK